MPIHTYMCAKCDTTKDKLVKFEDTDNQTCETCEEKLVLIPTFSTSFQLKGRWYKNTKGY